MQNLQLYTDSPQGTLKVGRSLARWLQPGDLISLEGDLGAGKTVLTKGIAAGLGLDPRVVTSPTYSLVHEYDGDIPLYHFDAYRLQRPEEWEDIGYEEYQNAHGISVVEWGNRVEEYFPPQYLRIELFRVLGMGEKEQPDRRRLRFTAKGEHFEAVLEHLREEVELCGSWR